MRLGRILGIPVFLHWSFLALLGFLTLRALVQGGVAEAAWTLAFDVGLFGSVLLHELGHALAARGFAIRTRDITLYPFGGVASLTSMPRTPWQELVVAIAGPLVNFALALALGAAGLVWGLWPLTMLAAANLFMGLFNLIPAFPMDGGRVLRALLVPGLGYRGASQTAIRIGGWFAWAFLIGGAVSGWWSLALVGGFLMLALRAERARLAWEGRGWRAGGWAAGAR
jgi:Zn-dependent protease